MRKLILNSMMVLSLSSFIISCNDDDENMMMNTVERTLTIENVVASKDFVQSGAFFGEGSETVDAPVVLPGQSISFKFNAGKGQKLMFATMYGASKDWFFAPENPGINLYDNSGNAITGDVSAQVKLWDNGSKTNDTGETENNLVAMVSGVNAADLMKLMLDYNAERSEFTLTITNTSGGTMNETPFSPGVWAVSNVLGGNLLNEKPLYEAGKTTNPEITAIAEGGNVEPMKAKLDNNTGIITGLSPAIVLVYEGNTNPLFMVGQKDKGNGLKELAQTGNTEVLKQYFEENSVNVKKVFVIGNAPIGPGQMVSVQIEAEENQKIAVATMFGYSNDWFYANKDGISLDVNDVTSQFKLYDNGTAKDQFPGAGNSQGLFGGMPIPESKNIGEVNVSYTLPSVSNVIKVTLN